MDPRDLIRLPRGTLLSEVVQQPCVNEFLSSLIYKVGGGVYLIVSPFRPGSLDQDSTGPFVVGIALAASDGAIRRALLMDIESDDGETMSVPSAFLPPGGVAATTYSEILHGLKNDKPRVCNETAAYRIASDGRFIHRLIETERFSFFFRSPEHDDSEVPYAIMRKLV